MIAIIAASATLAAAPRRIWDPPAIDVFPDHDQAVRGQLPLETVVENGKRLFKTVFNARDGAGRPESTGDSKPTLREPPALEFQRLAGPDASSCADCHNQPIQGGSGGLATNVFVGAHRTDPPTTRIDATITSERNTTTIFGAGAIEMVAYEMTEELQAIRQQALFDAERQQRDIRVPLRTKGISFGHMIAKPNGTYDSSEIEGVDMDLVVKPFGVKGVAVSLREFTNFALNHHHGIQTEERFGWVRTGIRDFDADGVVTEFTIGQVSAVALYQASLPPPSRVPYADARTQSSAQRGERLFDKIGCTSCHVAKLPLSSAWFFEPNPYNRPGSAVPADVSGQIVLPIAAAPNTGVYRDAQGLVFVAAYTDLKRHRICDAADPFFCNERVLQDFVPTDQFLTSKLWDAGTSAPYGHRGNLPSISEAILHHSAEGAPAKRAFVALSDADKTAVIDFLRSLQVIEEKQP